MDCKKAKSKTELKWSRESELKNLLEVNKQFCFFWFFFFCDFPNFNLFANDLNPTQIYRAYSLCCSLEITVNVWNSLFLSERLIISIKLKIIRYYNFPLNKFSTQLVMFSLMISMHIFLRTVNRIILNYKSEKYSYIDYIV